MRKKHQDFWIFLWCFRIFLIFASDYQFVVKMFYRLIFSRFRPVAVAFLVLFLGLGHPKANAQATSPGLDIFSGLDFYFKDLDFQTQYKFLIRLTPGFKWNMGNHWQLAGQVIVPVVNQYGDYYKYVRLNMFNVSKEFRVGHLYLKTTAGLFSREHYGLDVKAFLPLCKWFAFEGQAGWVGIMQHNPNFWICAPNRFAWIVGGDIYLSQWNTQFRGIAGKYLYQDYGFEVEAMRHFNHTTISVYGCWNNVNSFDAGFRIVIMLPPYHRTHRMVNFRPISNWNMDYTVMYHQYDNIMYRTDPEENKRDGWFSRDLLQWGSHTMEPDFIIKEKKIE